MYEPVLNSVLVQIDDKEGEWGAGNDESMLGKSYRYGTVIRVGDFFITREYPTLPAKNGKGDFATDFKEFVGKKVMWNEGTEAGTTFEFDGKLFGMIYWWDIRGVLVGK